MKPLSHSFAARADASAFEAVRRCAAPERPGNERASGAGLPPAGAVSGHRIALRFAKTSKLLRHSDFQRVYKQGRRHFAAHMTVFYLQRTDGTVAGPRVGFTVGRILGGAVDRNRIKRRLREAVRHHLSALALRVDVVINPKKSALLAEFAVLDQEIARAFQVISEKARI
ncbi:MAG: ribonuclease P protein component [Terriglobales bacterium]